MIFRITCLISIFLLTITTYVSCKKLNVSKKQDVNKTTYNIDSTTVKFKGVITNVKNECWSDGICSVEVNGKWWIIITEGLTENIHKEHGQTIGIQFTKDNESIGKKVAVYAKIRNSNKLTLEGSKTYYVKVIDNLKPQK